MKSTLLPGSNYLQGGTSVAIPRGFEERCLFYYSVCSKFYQVIYCYGWHMSYYRRTIAVGGCFFFTVVTYNRIPWFSDSDNVQLLRNAFKRVILKHPFKIDAIVVLPDHIHTIWQLPENDSDYSLRWRLLKSHFSRQKNLLTNARKEKPVWQRRYWEHLIKDEHDWRTHLDYIHYNPVKHGLVSNPLHWPYSSFRQHIKNSWYTPDWGTIVPDNIKRLNFE